MIQSCEKRVRALLDGKAVKGIDPRLQRRIRDKLAQLDSSLAIEEMRVPPGNRLERLGGELQDYWSVRVNDQWRIIFRWEDDHAWDVRLVDYHSRCVMDDIHSRRADMDLSEVVSGERLPPFNPGDVLQEDFLEPLGLSQYKLAKDTGLSPIAVSQIIRGERAITAETALRLSRYFGTEPDWWLRLQNRRDLELAAERLGDSLTAILPAR